jgi:DNA repair photolyase
MLLARRFGNVKTYKEWCQPKLVRNALQILEQEIPRFKNKIKSVHLCFTTDPFMYKYEEIGEMSYQIISRLNKDNIKCTVLTKGLLPVKLANLKKDNEYGITLVSFDENFQKSMEEGSAPYRERVKALKALHDLGCKTWVSIEPYPTPNFVVQDINDILKKLVFVDKIIFGRLNYNAKVREYKDYQNFFNETAKTVMQFCQEYNIVCLIKQGTLVEKD